MDEEYDNDYAENYFDNGEGDDFDGLGDGGGGDEGFGGGGGGTYLTCFLVVLVLTGCPRIRLRLEFMKSVWCPRCASNLCCMIVVMT